ncbi:MAG: hypothetical protein K0R20_2653, partial [Actinomycetia bacterium]|nr:hypothetical protein [Actinomycetes bacterium]
MSARQGISVMTRRGPRRVLSCIALFSMVVSLTIANGASVFANEGDPTATESPSPEPSPEPSPSAEPTSDSILPVSPATIQSDKLDYPPGGHVVLTGSFWLPGETINIVVNDDVGATWRRDVNATANLLGDIRDEFNLPDWFVATYSVRATGLTSGFRAESSFTDSPTKITAKSHEGQLSPSGSYTSGNITTYSEGESINFRFDLEATHGPTGGQLQVRYTGDDGVCLFFDGDFALGTVEAISGSQPTVTLASGPTPVAFGTSNGEWVVTLDIDYPGTFGHSDPASIARVNYSITLSDEAGECTGSSQHSRLNAAGGTVEQSGAQNVPVPANQVIELPEILVTKRIDRDANG